MKASELDEILLPYLPEEAEWKKEYLAMLALGKRPSCRIPEELPVFTDETARGNDWSNYFWQNSNVAVHRHWRYFPVNYHTHLFLEIMYMYNGSGTNFVEGVRTRMKAGDFCVMSPRVYHIFEHDGDSVLVNIMVRTRYIEQIFRDSFHSDGVFAAFMRSLSGGESHPKCMYVHPNGDDELVSLANHLLCAYYGGSSCVDEELCCWLRLLFARMITSAKCVFQPSEMHYREKSPVMPILSYIYGCCTEVTRQCGGAVQLFQGVHLPAAEGKPRHDLLGIRGKAADGPCVRAAFVDVVVGGGHCGGCGVWQCGVFQPVVQAYFGNHTDGISWAVKVNFQFPSLLYIG